VTTSATITTSGTGGVSLTSLTGAITVGGSISAVGNVTAGNLVTGGAVSATGNATVAGSIIVNDTSVQYSAKIYANGSIASRNGGVDGAYADAFVTGYSSNYNEKNIIQTAVSSDSASSGFRFKASDGAGLATTTTVLDLTRSQAVYYTNILPSSNGTYNLGSASARWANIFTSDLSLSNEAKGPNDVDGTTGNWTIQEGAEDLFIINNKSGKKYKFALIEIPDKE
jgi:cytoskeletal protein CcmA (bactofilin family)